MFEGAHSDFGLVGDSPEIQRVLRFIHKLRDKRSPVLLLGETGTGKELVARALHDVSPGAAGAFVAINTAALPGSLLESELFGHAKGSFTGATESRRGLIEQAHGGTLFLDEIGEFPLELQAKLLRALQENTIRPIGSTRTTCVDVRIIAATNRDLAYEVEQGRFRADLFYRLNVLSIRLAPLRDHREDIPLLLRHFLEQHAKQQLQFSQEALDCLLAYDWPGNARQLENCMCRIAALASGEEVHLAHLPTLVRSQVEKRPWTSSRSVMTLARLEQLAIEHAIQLAGGDHLEAARLLGISKSTMYRKLKEYNSQPKAHAAAV